MICSPTPGWELMKADFDIEYTEMKKEENPHTLSYMVKSHLADNYSNHLKIYTDNQTFSSGGFGEIELDVLVIMIMYKSYLLLQMERL